MDSSMTPHYPAAASQTLVVRGVTLIQVMGSEIFFLQLLGIALLGGHVVSLNLFNFH